MTPGDRQERGGGVRSGFLARSWAELQQIGCTESRRPPKSHHAFTVVPKGPPSRHQLFLEELKRQGYLTGSDVRPIRRSVTDRSVRVGGFPLAIIRAIRATADKREMRSIIDDCRSMLARDLKSVYPDAFYIDTRRQTIEVVEIEDHHPLREPDKIAVYFWTRDMLQEIGWTFAVMLLDARDGEMREMNLFQAWYGLKR